MLKLLEPKEIIIDNEKFLISKFTAIAGREIISQYPLSAIPKLGDYKTNEEIMLKMMKFVAKVIDGKEPLILSERAVIDNHVKSWESLIELEKAVIGYNCSFFQNGRVSNFLEDIAQKLPLWISRILTEVSQQLLQPTKQLSTNSERPIP